MLTEVVMFIALVWVITGLFLTIAWPAWNAFFWPWYMVQRMWRERKK